MEDEFLFYVFALSVLKNCQLFRNCQIARQETASLRGSKNHAAFNVHSLCSASRKFDHPDSLTMSTAFTLEGLCVYLTETFTAGVIQAYEGQGLLEDAPLTGSHDPLECFGRNDSIFQEYNAPEGNSSKMAWKESRPPKWWKSLFKSMKFVFIIQILGGLALGTFAISILTLDFNSVDLCFNQQLTNWKSLPNKVQAIIVTAASSEAYLAQLWVFFYCAAYVRLANGEKTQSTYP